MMESTPPPDEPNSNINPNWLMKVIDSFDQLSYVLAPANTQRLPTSAHKVPWEIRPRNRSIQQVFRAIRVLPGNDDDAKRASITRSLARMKRPIETFLASKKIRTLSGMNEIQERWLASVKSNGAAARRRRDALVEVDREAVEFAFGLLNERIRDDLVAVEEVLWPRRVIKLDAPLPAAPSQDVTLEASPSVGFILRWAEWFSIVAWVNWIIGR